MSFHSLGLSKPLLDALAAKDYSQATPIQTQAIPTVLTGRDLLGIAQTGTGKTAAFMLPSLDRLSANRNIPKPGQIRMLVLAPTRELASQIAESARNYARNINLTVGVIFGGTAPMKSVRGMRARARPFSSRVIIGSVKAAVLPVPVWAMPSTSRRAST